MWDLVPWQGSDQGPLLWEHGIPTTGPRGDVLPGQFLCSSWVKDDFYFLKWVGGKKTGTIRDVCKLCEIPVSVFINRILWKPSPTVALPIVCGHFCATGEELSGYDKRLTTWLAEPKIFTNWSFTKRSQPLFRGSGRDWRSICQHPCWDNISIGTKTQRCRRVLAGCQESRASRTADGHRQELGDRGASTCLRNTQVLPFPPRILSSALLRGHRL